MFKEPVQLALVFGCVGLAAYALLQGQSGFAYMIGGGLLGALNPSKPQGPTPQTGE